jgi:hypothetical protein
MLLRGMRAPLFTFKQKHNYKQQPVQRLDKIPVGWQNSAVYGSLEPLQRFGLGIGRVHRMINKLGTIYSSRFRINSCGVARIGCPISKYS